MSRQVGDDPDTRVVAKTRQELLQHYTRILTRWPVDKLRQEPKQQFQSLLQAKIEAARAGKSTAEATEINAAYQLLDNTFKHRYPVSQECMTPLSNPTHYTNLEKELSEIPNRSWLDSTIKRLSNMVRWR